MQFFFKNYTPEASLLIPIFSISVFGNSCFPFLCSAVHVMISFSASISLVFFLFNCIPKAGCNAKEVDSERK